jgi:hypothetical protein
MTNVSPPPSYGLERLAIRPAKTLAYTAVSGPRQSLWLGLV